MGFNTVSFYVHWGLIEPKRGEISFEGFRDLQPFFDAAQQAGLYLIARPGWVIAYSGAIFVKPQIQSLHQRGDCRWWTTRLGNLHPGALADR